MDFFNRLNLCRLCLCRNRSLIHIFDLNILTGYVVADVISDLLLFEVNREDGYPPFVCYACFNKLAEFKMFRDRCRESKSTYDREFFKPEVILGDGSDQEEETHRPIQPTREELNGSLVSQRVEGSAEGASEELPAEGDIDEESLEDGSDTQFEIHMSPVKLEFDEEDIHPNSQGSAVARQLFPHCDADGEIADAADRLHPNIAVSNPSNDSGMEITMVPIKVEPEEDAEDEEVACNPIDFVQTSLEYKQLPQMAFEMIKVEREDKPYEVMAQFQSRENSWQRRRRLNRERQRRHRANYTPEKLMQTRLLDAQRQAFKRMNETPEEKRERRLLDAQRMARRRMNESPDEKARRRRIEAERQALRRHQKRMLATNQP